MRTRGEIKRNNIRKANLMVEAKQRTNRGNMSSSFGLFNEQCGVPVGGAGRDTEGVYMGAPEGTEPMMDMPMMGGANDMPLDFSSGGMMGNMEGVDDDDMVMDDQMMMMFMEDYEEEDHDDRDEFDGRDSEVIGVYSNNDDEDGLVESYKAVTAQPTTDSWGNKYNHILNESSKVNGAKSLMHRMKRVIR